jgi:para-nitrobenzyl esterase
VEGVVSVAQGRLRGVRRGDHWSFSGVPYARAPVGRLRWRPPMPAEPWNGVRDASTFGPIAPQSTSVPGITSPSDPGASEAHSEDCLFLNVWTPDLPEPSGGAQRVRRPVLVFIHGGGFTSGSGSVFLYRGGNLVRNGDAVVVTINYRLGALGFLGHRGLGDPDGLVGNWGIHDQVAALTWVRHNIGAFGGDADNVTIFGESAGGFSVATLLGTPSARGLFRRAIVQSGGVHVHTVEQAELAAGRLASVLGISRCSRESLETVPASELVAATEEIGRRRPDPGAIPLPYLPVVDGVFIPEHPLAAVATGTAAGVDLMIGTNRDELTLFGLGNPSFMALDEEGMRRLVANAVPDMDGAEVVDVYRDARGARGEPVEPTDIWVAAGTDIVFRWPSLQLAAAQVASGSTCTSLTGSHRPSEAFSVPATPWSSPSSSVWSTYRWSRSSREAGPPSGSSPSRCSRLGSPSPPTDAPGTRGSAIGIRGTPSPGRR